MAKSMCPCDIALSTDGLGKTQSFFLVRQAREADLLAVQPLVWRVAVAADGLVLGCYGCGQSLFHMREAFYLMLQNYGFHDDSQ
jgi:hypothetical protein